MNPRGYRVGAVRSALAMLLTLGVLGGWSAPAAAQHNSLLRSGAPLPAADELVATTRPAPEPAPSPAAGVRARPAPPGSVEPGEGPPVNTVLLAASPLAIEPPKPRAYRVHDLITVIVRESRTSLNDAKLKSEKDWQLKLELAKWLRLDEEDHLVSQDFTKTGPPGADLEFENTYEGKGKYDRKDELTTRITATVIDVKPNGNLVLAARKRIKVGDELLKATLTGECRSADVTAQNTVLSTQLADLEVEMPDEGAVRDATRRGWLMRLLDFTRPF